MNPVPPEPRSLFRPQKSVRGNGCDGFRPKPMTTRAVEKLIERYVKALKLDANVTVHWLRVTARHYRPRTGIGHHRFAGFRGARRPQDHPPLHPLPRPLKQKPGLSPEVLLNSADPHGGTTFAPASCFQTSDGLMRSRPAGGAIVLAVAGSISRLRGSSTKDLSSSGLRLGSQAPGTQQHTLSRTSRRIIITSFSKMHLMTLGMDMPFGRSDSPPHQHQRSRQP